MRTLVSSKLITYAVVSMLATVLVVVGAFSYFSPTDRISTQSQAAESMRDKPIEVFPDTTAAISAHNLENLIAEYNAQQKATCSEFEMIEQCEGASQLEVQEVASDQFILLKKTSFVVAHTLGVDVGEDIFANYVFKKSEPVLEKVIALEGDVYLLAGNKLALQVPARNSCLGHMVEGELNLFDLEQGDAVYTYNFSPAGESLIGAEFRDAGSEDEVVVAFAIDSEISKDDENQDNMGAPVERIQREFQLRCMSNGRECALTKISEERSENETYIGGCD